MIYYTILLPGRLGVCNPDLKSSIVCYSLVQYNGAANSGIVHNVSANCQDIEVTFRIQVQIQDLPLILKVRVEQLTRRLNERIVNMAS